MTIHLDHATFAARTARLAERSAALAERRDAVAAEVDSLLSGWQGAAALAFAEAWTLWREGADDVVASLDADVAALTHTRADLSATDTARAEVQQRLGLRLG